jgi:hypothetical protein
MGIKSENIQIYKYLTRPARPQSRDASVEKLEKVAPTINIESDAMDDYVRDPEYYHNVMPEMQGMEDPKLRQVELAEGGMADQTFVKVVKPATAMQEKIAQKVYGKTFNALDADRRAKIRAGRITMNSTGVNIMPVQERIAYTQKRMQDFVSDFAKERGRLPSRQEIRNIGRFEIGTVNKYIDQGIIQAGEKGATMGLTNPKVIELKNDLRLLDNNTYIRDSFRKGQVPNINEVSKILNIKDKSIAAYRVGQLAATYTGDRQVEGIKPKFKKGAEFIFENADTEYAPAFRRVRELQIGKSVGEKSISTTKNAIKRLLQDAYPEGASYAIDEPAGISSSVRRGTTPYGIFGQIIDSEINNTLKYAFDRRKSVLEQQLQNAIENGTPAEKKSAVKKFNDVVSEYETKLNEGVKPGQKRIKLFKVSLDNPEKTIANYSELSDSYKDAFQKNYKTRGYAFQVPKDIKPLSQIADELKIEENRAKLSKAAFKGDKRVYSTFLPGANIVESLVDITGEGLKDIGKGAMKLSPGLVGKGLVKLLPGAGTAYGIYDTAIAFQEGKSTPEIAFRFVGADPLYNMVREYERLPEQAQEIQKKKNLQESFDAAGKDIIDEGLVQMFGRPEITPEEDLYLKQEKQKVQQTIEQENKDRAAGRHGYIQQLKSSFTNEPMEFAKGGRVFFKDGSKPVDVSRRKFIKFAASLAALPFLGKFIKPATKAAPEVVEAISKTAESVPTYLNDLISKIKMMGSSKVLGKADNPEGFVKYQLGDYEVTDGSNFTRVKRVKDEGDYGYQEFEMELRKDPETGGLEYEEISVKPDRDGKLKDFEFGIEDDVHLEMKKFADED